jgi:hypothetical protein
MVAPSSLFNRFRFFTRAAGNAETKGKYVQIAAEDKWRK